MGITKLDTNLRRGQTLSSQLANLVDDFIVGGLQPSRSSAAVGSGRARNTFSVAIKSQYNIKIQMDRFQIFQRDGERKREADPLLCIRPMAAVLLMRKKRKKEKKEPRFFRRCFLTSNYPNKKRHKTYKISFVYFHQKREIKKTEKKQKFKFTKPPLNLSPSPLSSFLWTPHTWHSLFPAFPHRTYSST